MSSESRISTIFIIISERNIFTIELLILPLVVLIACLFIKWDVKRRTLRCKTLQKFKWYI